jgi:flavodoxin
MKALVIYDSVYGNTEKVAQMIADSLNTSVLLVGQVTPEC